MLPFAHFRDRRNVETKSWNRKCILVGAKTPGCVVSVLSDTLSIPMSVSFWHLRTISNRYIIFLLIIIRVPVESKRR